MCVCLRARDLFQKYYFRGPMSSKTEKEMFRWVPFKFDIDLYCTFKKKNEVQFRV